MGQRGTNHARSVHTARRVTHGPNGPFPLGSAGVREALGGSMSRGEAALPAEVLQELVEAGQAIVADLDPERVVRTVMDTATTLTHAAFGMLLYEPRGSGAFRGASFSGFSREALAGFALPQPSDLFPSVGGVPTAVRDDDVTDSAGGARGALHYGLPVSTLGVRSYLAVPVTAPDGEVVAALVLGHPKPSQFEEQDVRRLEGIAAFARIGLANAREHAAEREIAAALQQAMLPTVGFHEGVEVAVRYRPAARRAQVGGDWYDVLRLDDGRLALTVGDVAGHNVNAAARMGTVRNVLGVHVLREVDPARSLLALEDHLTSTGQRGFVTVVQALFDPSDASLVIARAGHLPPLVVPAQGEPRYLEGDPAPPIGVGLLRRAPETVRVELGLEDTILFFTDGLVEQRRTPTDVRMSRLRDLVAASTERTAEGLCDEVLARFVDAGGADDDVAMLALRPLSHVPVRTGPRDGRAG